MCGIAGIVSPDPHRDIAMRRMLDALSHRGPDGEGIHHDEHATLGHRRLSIIDLSGAAAQPMLSADGRLAISYNGEIYNFREVRTELESKGHVFRTESDTEVILAAWRQWGPDCLERLNGMFALALYDTVEDALFLARDRLGVKPLFYAELPDGALVFASELKGLLAHPLLRRIPSAQGIETDPAWRTPRVALSERTTTRRRESFRRGVTPKNGFAVFWSASS